MADIVGEVRSWAMDIPTKKFVYRAVGFAGLSMALGIAQRYVPVGGELMVAVHDALKFGWADVAR